MEIACVGMRLSRARVRLSRAWDDANGDARGDRGTMVDALSRARREGGDDDDDDDDGRRMTRMRMRWRRRRRRRRRLSMVTVRRD